MSSDESNTSGNGIEALSPATRARLQKCFEYGNKQMQMGNHDYATDMFIQCVTGDPGNLIYMQTYIGNIRIKYGNNKKGASFGFFKSGGAKGSLKTAEMRKKWADVLKAGCEALKTNPWDDAVFFSMGKACLEMGYSDTGLAYLKHAVECNPEDVEINRVAATELGARHIYEQSIACWQRILNQKPDDLEAQKAITDLLMEQTIKRVEAGGPRAEAVRKSNDSAGTGEEPEETEVSDDPYSKLTPEDGFEKRLAKNPNNRNIYEEMYEYFFQKGNLKKAEETCRRALAVFAKDDVFSFRMADVQVMRSREELERIKQLFAKEPSAQLKEQFAKQKADYDAKKLTIIKIKLERNPNSGQLHMEYGQYLMKHGQFKEAINEFQAAKIDQTIKGECMLALAFCFQQIQQYRLAMMHFESALESLTGEGEYVKEALYHGARLAYHLEDYKKADDFAHRLAIIDFSYKDLGDLLDKIAKKCNNN